MRRANPDECLAVAKHSRASAPPDASSVAIPIAPVMAEPATASAVKHARRAVAADDALSRSPIASTARRQDQRAPRRKSAVLSM